MKRIFSFLLLLPLAGIAQDKVSRPKLIVGIVVDQMRWDYLYRYYELYSSGGFKRMMNDGFSCENTMISYLPSFTAPGHTCVYTGTVPSMHGIAANDWIDNLTGREWYCTEDTTVSTLNGSRKAGMMSPRNLLASTITDELRLATNFKSKVYGVALKDRGSILPAGHLANGAYWFDDSTGNFISSSYYGDRLPGWLTRFNEQHYAAKYMKQDWNLLYDAKVYDQSLADNNVYEGKLKGEKDPVFPHKADAKAKNYGGIRYLPAGNKLSIEMAKACIDGAHLGQGSGTDFFCLSLSSTDYVGHMFTPNSMEAEDMYLRLDKQLAGFLAYLDEIVGNGNYLVFLTADHGAAHNAKYMQDIKMHGGNESEQGRQKELNAMLKKQFGKDSLVRAVTNYQVYLNEKWIAAARLSRDKVKTAILQWLRVQGSVAYAVDMELMDTRTVPEPLASMIVNGYNAKRSGCIQMILQPGYYDGYAATGTTHGTWNPYDTHIPLLWYGWHIPKGTTNRTTHMTDISATLAALLHIQMPNACVGAVITELTR